MSQLDVVAAKKALAARLKVWGVPNAEVKAAGFIDDLVGMGWSISPLHETRAHPSKLADECRIHPGRPAPPYCGGCNGEPIVAYSDPTDVQHLSAEDAIKVAREAAQAAATQRAANA